MRKTEFMDLLKYYFRKSDKDDLKGILDDCEEQFRLGAKKGLSEEEICCKLGHPKNIYRYYIGEPIVPEDNPRMPDTAYGNSSVPRRQEAPYDWEKEPDRLRRHAESEQYYHQPAAGSTDGRQPVSPQRRQPLYDTDEETGKNFQWNDSDSAVPTAAKAVASPFLDIFGALCNIISGILYFVFALACIASVAIYNLPAFFFTDLLPLPTLSLSTMGFGVLAILFAALTFSYASQACHQTAQQARRTKGGRA